VVSVQLTGELRAARKGGAFVELPPDVLAGLGGGSRFRVTGTVDDVPFESSTMAMGGGRVCLGLHRATREAAGVGIGDQVRLVVERDDRPREVTVPDDLAQALAGDEVANTAFDTLALSHRREYVDWVTSAKRGETRARRVAQTLERLHP